MKFHISKIAWAIRALIYKPFTKSLGFPSYIGKPIFVSGLKRIDIGKRVRIFPHARFEAMRDGTISIEDNVYIGQNCHITSEGSCLRIAAGSAIMANVCITNIDHIYTEIDKPVLEQGYDTKETSVGANCFIGHGAVIQAGTILGNHCIVGANAVVRGSFPDYSVIVGVPGRAVKNYDVKTKQWQKVNQEESHEFGC